MTISRHDQRGVLGEEATSASSTATSKRSRRRTPPVWQFYGDLQAQPEADAAGVAFPVSPMCANHLFFY
jgi:hypothetical protein